MKKLLHFSAVWCVPCQKSQPLVDQFLRDNPDIEYTKIDIDKDPDVAKEYSIMGVPTFISYSGGKQNNRHTGAPTVFQLKSLFN